MSDSIDAEGLDFPEYAGATLDLWNNIAEWWDDTIGDGNRTQDLLEATSSRLLELRPGMNVLDIACGAGRYARKMADAGASVTAIDQSEVFLERARVRSAGYEESIDYRVIDAANAEALLSLGENRFDAAVCTMSLMDMAVITPLLSSLPKLLQPGASFVFSVTHPVFNSGDARPTIERIEVGNQLETRYSVGVADYLDARMVRSIGVAGQPELTYYFHRPIGALLNACFEYSFVLDRFEEPAYQPDSAEANPVSQVHFHHIPWNLIVRLRSPRA